MITVWKYNLKKHEYTFLQVPEGAKFLDVKNQDNQIVLYALVDTEAKLHKRTFVAFATGQEINVKERIFYIGTCQFQTEWGEFVQHIFAVKNEHQ